MSLFCSLCLHRSAQTALLPEMDAFERGIAFYRYSRTRSTAFILSHTATVTQHENPFIFNGSTLKGELAPAVTVGGGNVPPRLFQLPTWHQQGFLRVLVQDGAVLQLMASCGIAERL